MPRELKIFSKKKKLRWDSYDAWNFKGGQDNKDYPKQHEVYAGNPSPKSRPTKLSTEYQSSKY